MADEAAGLAPGQLGDVGVLLLRQHRRARGVGVVEAQEAELLGRPQDDLLAQAATGGRRAGRRSNSASATKSRSETASREFSNAAGEAQVGGHARRGRAGSDEPARAPAPRGETSSRRAGVEQAVDVAGQRPDVGQQVVGEQDRLGPLQVGVARQVGVAGGLGGPASRTRWSSWTPAADRGQLALGRRGAGRWRPGRCGCGRCGAWRRRDRPAR